MRRGIYSILFVLILAVSHATVFRLIKSEGLPVTKMRHTTRIPQQKLHTWIEEHTA